MQQNPVPSCGQEPGCVLS
ncbi:hypothetical protein CIB84_012325 [Bambusicola thoracicus]|uniref:Uncharacterized protein n=1 Tax=Bambusicola thoracicus TaxID=9083 RepID=A0A2P4SII6_BAMTH|nr:hypothetical protein CIB84_012325 [Bambusicola thoracicus]